MVFSPLVRQLLVAGSPQLAALAVGGAVSYPSVLLHQLKSNESTIHVDLDTSSWIGSIQGLTGLPSILMPLFMQWKGRKLAFIVSCVISILGWLTAYTATSIAAILASESLHGLGTNCLLAASLLTMSEMIAPRWRSMSMVSFYLVQAFGIASNGIMSQYLHWKTISLIMCMVMTLAFLIALTWPESPSWLAYKGEFEKCEEVFVYLRGTDDDSIKELKELIAGQKENLAQTKNKSNAQTWNMMTRKDFYLPSLYTFVLLNLFYWSGGVVVLIYSSDIIRKSTGSEKLAGLAGIIVNSIPFVGISTATILLRYFGNKSILLWSTFGTAASLTLASIVTFLQSIETLPKDSTLCLYCIVAYMVTNSLGIMAILFSMTAELMPVKHRGIGGGLYILFVCVLHATSLKSAPYLFAYLELWGTFLIYAVTTVVCGVFLWRYIPETKGRTLQELEDYYNDGCFIKRDTSNVEAAILKNNIID